MHSTSQNFPHNASKREHQLSKLWLFIGNWAQVGVDTLCKTGIHSLANGRVVQVWAFLEVNFDPVQEIGPKFGDWLALFLKAGQSCEIIAVQIDTNWYGCNMTEKVHQTVLPCSCSRGVHDRWMQEQRWTWCSQNFGVVWKLTSYPFSVVTWIAPTTHCWCVVIACQSLRLQCPVLCWISFCVTLASHAQVNLQTMVTLLPLLFKVVCRLPLHVIHETSAGISLITHGNLLNFIFRRQISFIIEYFRRQLINVQV